MASKQTLTWLFLSLSLFFASLCAAQNKPFDNKTTIIPLLGNTFFSNYAKSGVKLSKAGIENWTDPSVLTTIYVRFLEKGRYPMSLTAKSASKTTLHVSMNGLNKTIEVKNKAWKKYPLGSIEVVDTGYMAIILKGVKKAGANFADIQSLEIGMERDKLQFVGDDFYFGRRGPSVHLSYQMPPNKSIEWFYNEVTIPKGKDEIGSYYMANGFKEGYFGIQVNSETERRILFSVWSPFTTDDPKSIPDSLKIVLLRKGKNTHIGEFGNEGSGGQSYLKFNWKGDITYRFLTQVKPTDNNSTIYTAYFYDTEAQKWLLIASFKRPATHTWYTQPHSFLENFEPERGTLNRKGFYNNQWVCETSEGKFVTASGAWQEGIWTELTTAKFKNDATGRKKARMDFKGGVENNQFFLSNCGFFSDYTLPNTFFERKPMGEKPVIDFNALPKEKTFSLKFEMNFRGKY